MNASLVSMLEASIFVLGFNVSVILVANLAARRIEHLIDRVR
ncbi:MAG: hypothetical protein AAF485_24820 [Chloroflexota bacterium]